MGCRNRCRCWCEYECPKPKPCPPCPKPKPCPPKPCCHKCCFIINCCHEEHHPHFEEHALERMEKPHCEE